MSMPALPSRYLSNLFRWLGLPRPPLCLSSEASAQSDYPHPDEVASIFDQSQKYTHHLFVADCLFETLSDHLEFCDHIFQVLNHPPLDQVHCLLFLLGFYQIF
jgi:hypothetical protein